MKKTLKTFLAVSIALIFANDAVAQKFSKLDVSPMDAAAYPTSWRNADKLVKIIYGRPQLKGREMTTLANGQDGNPWRTGANEAPEITFYKDLTFGGKNIKAGTYTMFTIPGESTWTIIISSATNVWGSYFYNQEEDVVRIEAEVSKTKEFVEAFSIAFDGEGLAANMYLGWGDTLVTIPIKAE